jgi:hypothetical protein
MCHHAPPVQDGACAGRGLCRTGPVQDGACAGRGLCRTGPVQDGARAGRGPGRTGRPWTDRWWIRRATRRSSAHRCVHGPALPARVSPPWPARRVPARRVPARRVPARRVPARRLPARRLPARRLPARRLPARRLPARPPLTRPPLTLATVAPGTVARRARKAGAVCHRAREGPHHPMDDGGCRWCSRSVVLRISGAADQWCCGSVVLRISGAGRGSSAGRCAPAGRAGPAPPGASRRGPGWRPGTPRWPDPRPAPSSPAWTACRRWRTPRP